MQTDAIMLDSSLSIGNLKIDTFCVCVCLLCSFQAECVWVMARQANGLDIPIALICSMHAKFDIYQKR